MESNFISSPNDFCRMEGNSVDFKKTFDLNGTDNDDMLRLYLRKAGLSDEIECLSPEQRRAFIYDIIKSNKMPGYWMPSTMKTSSFGMAPPAVRPPPPPPRSTASSPYTERKNTPSTLSYASVSNSSSSGSLQSLSKNSPNMPQRFVPAPATPPSPSTFVTNSKGSRLEIGGPINFQHITGDMTRDMTRNAFDLSAGTYDNVLKKYMIERGITEDDVSGMRKQDLIRNIVQSKYTWMPPKRNVTSTFQPNIVYATISKNNEVSPPPSPQPSIDSWSSSPPSPTKSTPTAPVSNFTLIASRFADPSEFPSPDTLFGNEYAEPEPIRVTMRPLPPQVQRPAPPPRKSKPSFKKTHAPPPPSTITANSYSSSQIYQTKLEAQTENFYETIPAARVNIKSVATPLPPMPPNEMLYATAKPKHQKPNKPSSFMPAPPMEMAPKKGNANGGPPPPPPPPPPPAPMPISGAPHPPSQMPISGAPPPPPMPPPMPMGGGPPPAPPPPANQTIQTAVSKPPPGGGGDPRDAFLESIRNGVALKKVDKKAATISGIKPRPDRKPPVTDFLSELKMGLTLRRAKNPEDNPFRGDEPDESESNA